MKSRFISYIIIALTLGLLPFKNIDAQSMEDTLRQQKGFNALDYSLQKRYRQRGLVFENKHFTDNLFVGIFGGIDKIEPRAGADLSSGPQAGITLMKMFTPVHGLRLSGYWDSFKRKEDKLSVTGYGLMVDHQFNLSAMLNGYNPHRFLEIATVEGLGARLVTLNGKMKTAWDVHFGIQLKINTNSRFHVFLEPRITLLGDHADFSPTRNWHRYDVSYGGIVGVSYRLGNFYRRTKTNEPTEEEKFLANTFVSAGGGIQFQNSKLVKDMRVISSVGPNINVALGKWLINPVGLRLSAFASYNGWRANNDTKMDEITRYAGGRIEAIIDPVAFFRKDSKELAWGIVPMIGIEFGKMNKEKGNEAIKKSYAGLTGGVQLRYNYSKAMSFFIEPHASRVPYSFTDKDVTTNKVTRRSYMDDIISISLGIEIKRSEDTKPIFERTYKGSFHPYFYAGGNLGLGMPLQLHRYGPRRIPGLQVAALGGYQLTPYSGFRAGLDFTRVTVQYRPKQSYSYVSFAADYMLDVTNFMAGYDPERKLGAEAFVGPVVTMGLEPSEIYFGIETGGRLSYKLNDRVKVSLEPKFRAYTQNIIPKDGYKGTRYQLAILAGATYRF